MRGENLPALDGLRQEKFKMIFTGRIAVVLNTAGGISQSTMEIVAQLAAQVKSDFIASLGFHARANLQRRRGNSHHRFLLLDSCLLQFIQRS